MEFPDTVRASARTNNNDPGSFYRLIRAREVTERFISFWIGVFRAFSNLPQ